MLKKIVGSILLVSSTFAFSAEYVRPTLTDASVLDGRQSAVVFSKKTKNFTEAKAYKLQKAYVKNSVAKGVPIVGFKSGLTSIEAYKAYGLERPIAGVLLQAPLRGPKASLDVSDVQNPMIEMEFAYKVSQPIQEKITNDNVAKYIDSIAAAIEIPQINFPSNDFNGLDIIANNAMAYKLMIGEWQTFKSFNDVDAQKVTLRCDNKLLADGRGASLEGGQEKALVWLINHIIDHGYKIQKDQVLITGTLVKLTPAASCLYRAGFGKFGNLELLIAN
jgi:2-oxo-3-hexenedioate decarboxylase